MRKAITALAAAALFAIASPALAGGWAVTNFENLPDELQAGTTYSLDYTIRAHGQTPVDSGASHVMLRNFDADESLRFDAVNHGDGTYTVEIALPVEGSWQWDVTSEGWGTQELGVIEVAASSAVASGSGIVGVLKVVLPLATLIAAAFTLREWSRARVGTPTTETG